MKSPIQSLLALALLVCSLEAPRCAAFAPSQQTSFRRHHSRASFQSPLTTTHSQSQDRRQNNGLQAMATPGMVVAITGAITGGLFSGGLHAVAGPDHLAALLPRCCGQRWYKAGRVGALWGMGHGVSATLLGIVAFGLKNTLQKSSSPLKAWMTGASHVTEAAVGLSLILIGLMGLREAREWKDVTPVKSLSAAAAEDSTRQSSSNKAVIFNGILHGFSWDGAPSLAPALAVATWGSSLTFLLSYAVGTMSAMALVTTFVGEGTRRAGELFQRPDIPQKVSMVSSILAMAIGAIWVGLAVR